VVLLWPVIAGRGKSKWFPVGSDNGKFKAEMCGTIKAEDVPIVSTAINHTVFASRDDGFMLTLTWADYTEEAIKSAGGPTQLVDKMTMAASRVGSITNTNKEMRSGAYSHRVDYITPQDNAINSQLVLIKGTRLYTLTARGAQGDTTRDDTNRFFASFQLTE
jgi:hypothetical protein